MEFFDVNHHGNRQGNYLKIYFVAIIIIIIIIIIFIIIIIIIRYK